MSELDHRYERYRAGQGRIAAVIWYWRQVRGARSVATGTSWLVFGDWLRNARLGARKMLRRPAVSAALVLTLALGIGANAAIFSVVNQVLLQPLPYPEPERLRIPLCANVG